MRHTGLAFLVACSLIAVVPTHGHAQTSGFPSISQRQYTGGSARVTVTGAASIDEEVPLNAQASFSDGEMTWLQFGVSGAETPNSLITYGTTKETGISVGRGKFIVTGGIMPGERSECSGKAQVTEKEVVGEYTCAGLTSHDPATGMGTVNVTVRFTARS